MKPWKAALLIGLITAGCTGIQRLDSSKYEVLSVPQDLHNSNRLDEVARKLTNGIPVIFKLTQGGHIPLKLTIDLPVGANEKSDDQFVFKRDTYMFLSKNKFLLSPDGQRWASVQNLNSLAKLFGVKHGEIFFGFSTATNAEPLMSLEIKAR